MGWRRNAFTLCTQVEINAGTIYLGSGGLTCSSNCLAATLCSIVGYCIAFNAVDNWSYCEIINTVTVYKNIQYIEGTFASGAWIPLNNPSSSGGTWEIRSRIDTMYRADIASYNSCPTTIKALINRIDKY